MEVEKAYIVGVGLNNYRTGTPAEIIGVKIVEPDSKNGSLKFRPCYHVEWSDGKRDFIPISSVEDGTHKIITFAEVINESWKEEKEDRNKWVRLKCEKCGLLYEVTIPYGDELACLNISCDGKLTEMKDE